MQLGFGRHTAAVIAQYGEEHLFISAKYQMMGYRKNTGKDILHANADKNTAFNIGEAEDHTTRAALLTKSLFRCI